MSLNDTVRADRVHIAFFGKRNAGKSSLVNAVTNQELAIVSDIKGTTTDPVYKAMELLPLGPVVMIDTPGYDDEGELGELRVKKADQVMNKTDIGVLVADATTGLSDEDIRLAERLSKKNIPFIIVFNKSDMLSEAKLSPKKEKNAANLDENGDGKTNVGKDVIYKNITGKDVPCIYVSALNKTNIHELRELIASVKPENSERRLVGDLIEPSDMIILVMPQDEAAPKGRLILPQVQMIRDILDEHGMSLCVQTEETAKAIDSLKEKPKLVITDSQVFKKVAEAVPEEISLTSFSILLARYKGYLDSALKGVKAIKELKKGDKVLISEGCTHHRQCNDIGTVKIPKWLKEKLGFEVEYDTTSGTEFPDDLSAYKAVIHCGGCMLNEREITYRIKCAEDQGVPVVNYGILIAYLQGILDRAVAMLC